MRHRLIVVVCILSAVLSCSPVYARHGGRGGGGFNLIGAFAAQKAAWLKREAAAEALRRAKNNQQRMIYADRARKEGKPRLAAMLYLRVALQVPKDKHNGQAKAALKAMAKDGEAELKKADDLLAKNRIEEAFDKFDYLQWAYEEVPVFNNKIKSHLTKLRHDPRYEPVLKEKPAALLLAEAEKRERDDERCCAYWIYEEAAAYTPAPSAVKAAERFAAMQKDPAIVAEAQECRLLTECEKKFHSAELLEKTLPNQAVTLFKEILEKAPRDSEVHKDALGELAKLHGKKKG